MAGTTQLLSDINATLLQIVADLGEPTMKGNENVDSFYARYGFKEGIDPSKATDGNVPVLVAHLAEWADELRPKHIDALISEQEALVRQAEKEQAKEKSRIPRRFHRDKRPDKAAEARAQELRTKLDAATATGDKSAIVAAQNEYQTALEESLQAKAAYLKWEAAARNKIAIKKQVEALRKQKSAITKVSSDLLALQASIHAISRASDIDTKRKRVLAFKQRVLQIAMIVQRLLR